MCENSDRSELVLERMAGIGSEVGQKYPAIEDVLAELADKHDLVLGETREDVPMGKVKGGLGVDRSSCD